MNAEILYQFPITTLKKDMARTWHKENDGILAIAYISDMAEGSILSFLLFDIKTQQCLQKVSFTYPATHIEALHLAYDTITATWVICDIEFNTHSSSSLLVIREVHINEKGQIVISSPSFENEGNEMAPIGPLLALHVEDHHCICLYRKSEIDSTGTPDICFTHIDLLNNQTVSSKIITSAESALVCNNETLSLLMTLALQANKSSYSGYDRIFSLSGYDTQFDTLKWTTHLSSSLPAGERLVFNQGLGNDFEWLGINATAIPGPVLSTGLQTFVVGATMMDIFHLTGYGHTSTEASLISKKANELSWIDANGYVLQRCTASFGLRMQLCRSQSLVVGVDLLEGQWRLWNWEPLYASTLQSILWLDHSTLSAHLVKDIKSNKGCVWLIEESSKGVRISQRDASTLAEIQSGVTLMGVHLLEPQSASGALNWYTSVEAFCYEGTLILLGVYNMHQLTLYQIG